MATSKKKGDPFHLNNWDELLVLCEDLSGEYGLTPTKVWDCIADRFIRKNQPRLYWKLTRINLYLKQRLTDTRKGWIKFSKTRKKKQESFDQYKVRFQKLCGKDNKRINSVRRTVSSETYNKYFKIYFPDKDLDVSPYGAEVTNLNKLIADNRQDEAFDMKHHQTKKGVFGNQIVINMLR